MRKNLTFLVCATLLLSGCSTKETSKAECSPIKIEINKRKWDYRDTVGWGAEKVFRGREYANYVLSAPEECVSVEQISDAKTTLQIVEDLQ